MDVNVEMDELVLDGDVDPGTVADQLLMATGGLLAPGAAAQLGRAVLTAVSDRRGLAGSGGDGRQL